MPRLTRMPPLVAGFTASDRASQNKQADARRGSAASRGYDNSWDKASRAFREANPLCEYCALEGRVTATALTDHLYPVHQYPGVFWLRKWWVASCVACHSRFKQAIERLGKSALDALADRLGRDRHD